MKTTLSVPLKRDRQWDFACATGPAFYDAQVRHVLLTQGDSAHGAGELPWDTTFGTPLNTIRHASIDAGTVALVRNYFRTAFDRWLPHLKLCAIDVERLHNVPRFSVSYSSNAAGETLHRTIITVGGFARQ